MTYFSDFIKKPLNIFIIILLCFVLLVSLGVYREGFTSNNSSSGVTEETNKLYIDGEEIIERKFTGPNGNTAEIFTLNGKHEIIVLDLAGNVTKYSYSLDDSNQENVATGSKPTSNSNTNNKPSSVITQNTIFYGPFGGTAKITKGPNGNYLIQLIDSSGGTSYFIQNTSSQQSQQSQQNQGYPGYSTYANVQSTYQAPYSYPLSQQQQQPQQQNKYDYSNVLPPGIPANQIPPGQEDLYILKTEVIPPVCPASCPAPLAAVRSKTDTCAPCPPCGRCPKSEFECKKVPNYSSTNEDLPSAILSPYSTYGS